MRQTYLAAFRLLIFGLSVSNCFAAPSGGPYGPLKREYPLPEANEAFTVRYVSPHGDPAATGTSIDQPATLSAAIEQSRTGDFVILRGGVYRTGNITFNQGITIQPYLDEEPIIKGTMEAKHWEQVDDKVWSTRWSTLFPAEPADWWRAEYHKDTTPLHRFNYDMVFADGIRLESAGGIDEVTEKSYFIDYPNARVYIGKNPSKHNVEITAYDNALVRTMRPIDGRENDHKGPTIRGITFTQFARLALMVEGIEPQRPMDPEEYGKDIVGTTFENLTISYCSRVAGYFRGDHLTIRNCLASDCGTEGIYVINSSHVLLERNIVTRTNSHTPIMGYFASAVKIFNQSQHVICRDNLIINNPDSSGIWYDVGNRHNAIVNNWFENTNDAAFFEISETAVCAGNQFVNCNPGIRILNSADITVFHNTFYNSAMEVIRTMRSSEAGDHFGWHASAGPAVADRDRHVACNNLFLVDRTDFDGMVRIFQSPGVDAVAKDQQLTKLDNNSYIKSHRAENAALLMTGKPTYPPSDREIKYSDSFSGLQAIDPEYESSGQLITGRLQHYVQSPMLKRFELNAAFPFETQLQPVPNFVLEVLGSEYKSFAAPGAWAPVDR